MVDSHTNKSSDTKHIRYFITEKCQFALIHTVNFQPNNFLPSSQRLNFSRIGLKTTPCEHCERNFNVGSIDDEMALIPVHVWNCVDVNSQ